MELFSGWDNALGHLSYTSHIIQHKDQRRLSFNVKSASVIISCNNSLPNEYIYIYFIVRLVKWFLVLTESKIEFNKYCPTNTSMRFLDKNENLLPLKKVGSSSPTGSPFSKQSCGSSFTRVDDGGQERGVLSADDAVSVDDWLFSLDTSL